MLLVLEILMAALIGAAFAPAARSRTVMDAIVGEAYRSPTAEFVVNEEDGRAWVEVAVDNGSFGDDFDRQTLRARVEGLSYDAFTREIVYSDDGLRLVCARITTSRFLFSRQIHIRSTGRCELGARLERRMDDNGFEHTKNKHLVVDLNIAP